LTLARLMRSSELSAFIALVVLAGIFQLLNPAFLSLANIAAMLRAVAYPGLIAIGMAFCLISGLIDISAGALTGLVSCFLAWALVVAGWPAWLAIPAALALGVAGAIVNVTVILRLRIVAFIATIGAMYIFRGIAYTISGGASIYPLPAWLAEIGNMRPAGVSLAFWAFVAFVIAGEIALRSTVWGLKVRATGSSREIAKDTEVDVDTINYSTFALLGFLTALSAIFITLRTNGGIPTAGMGFEFRAIVGCAIGGVSLFGHDGSIVGAAIGMLLAQVIANGLVAVGMASSLQDVALGIVLMGVIALDVYKHFRLTNEVKI